MSDTTDNPYTEGVIARMNQRLALSWVRRLIENSSDDVLQKMDSKTAIALLDTIVASKIADLDAWDKETAQIPKKIRWDV